MSLWNDQTSLGNEIGACKKKNKTVYWDKQVFISTEDTQSNWVCLKVSEKKNSKDISNEK